MSKVITECNDVLLKYGYPPINQWQPTYDYVAQAKRDCMLYNPKRRRCGTLKRTYCKWEDCKFYKGREN